MEPGMTLRARYRWEEAMTVRQPRYSKEEFARRGDEIYNRDIRPQVEAGNKGFDPPEHGGGEDRLIQSQPTRTS